MSRHNFFHSSRFFQSGTTAGLLLMTSFFAFPAAAQTGGDPVEFGAQLPYVMILMDTSASMEWTDKGDARYPERIPAATDPNTINEWVQGTSLRVTNKVPAVETVGQNVRIINGRHGAQTPRNAIGLAATPILMAPLQCSAKLPKCAQAASCVLPKTICRATSCSKKSWPAIWC